MTKIRLSRFGSKGNPHYRIVVVDSRVKRDGGYIERVGYYDPRKTTKDWLKLETERVNYWLGVGAQPTDTVKKLIKISSAAAPTA